MIDAQLQRLAGLVEELKSRAEEARTLASGNPAADRNLHAILRHLEMLEIEICDPVRILAD